MPSEITNEDLGYGAFFEAGKHTLGLDEFSVARVISESRGAYKVKNAQGEYFAKVTGKQMFEASSREDYPAVGDWVAVTKLNDEQAVIEAVLPRATLLKRKHGDKNRIGEKDNIQIIATNIDVAFVIESVDRDYNLNRFERYFAIAENGGVKPAIIVNKIDLLTPEALDEKVQELIVRFPEIDIILTSTVESDGLSELKNYIEKGRTYCFLGSSGVGKSSLINTLLGGNTIKTGDISAYSGRGKHVTTARQMYFLQNGGIVIDNPGVREVGMTDVTQGVETFFDEITVLAEECRYTDCTHVHEPGCVVVNAVSEGTLDEEKYHNYLSLKKEAEHYEMTELEKRDKDRQFGKFVKSALKQFKKYDT